MSDRADGATPPREAARLLRAAADAARQAGRHLPRGPWRWGDPDVGDEPDGGSTPRHELWPDPVHRRPNPLDEPVPSHHRDPFGPSPTDRPPLPPHAGPRRPPVLDPAVAEPLATLLDALAGRLEDDGGALDPWTSLAAVSLARSLLRTSPTAPTAPGAPR